MSATPERLLQIKEKIKRAEAKRQQLKGQETQLLKQLDESFGCKSVEQAEKKLAEFQGKIDALNDKIQEGLKNLEEAYDWDGI